MSFRRLSLIAFVAAIGTVGCSRSPQAKADRFVENGKKQFEKKDYARASLEFLNAIKADPTNAEAHYRLANVQLATGNTGAAVAALRKALKLNPKHSAAQVKLAELMTAARSREVLEDAQSRLQEVLKAAPDSVDALDALAVAEVRLGKPELAEEHLNESLQKSPQNLKTSEALASLKYNRGDPKEAEEVLKKAIASAPQSPDAHIALGEFYRITSRPAEAEAEFRAALGLNPNNPVALLGISALQELAGHADQAAETLRSLSTSAEARYKPLYGIYLYQSGKKDAAIAEFERLVHENSQDREFRTRLVSGYVGVGRIADAEKIVTAALRRNPRDGDALLQRGEIYVMQNKPREAEQDLMELSKQRPNSGDLHYLLARAKQARGETLQAKEEYGKAVRLNPNLLVARIELARKLTAEGSAQAALNLLNEAPAEQHKLLPFIVQRNWEYSALGDLSQFRKGVDEGLGIRRSADLLLQDAMGKINQRNYAGAQTSLAEALSQAPDDVRLVGALADNYRAQKQVQKAVDLVRQYAARNSQSASAQRLLAGWLSNTGDTAGARKAFELIKALDPTDATADMSLAKMDVAEGKLDAARARLKPLVGAASDNLWVRTSSLSAEILLANIEEMTGNHRQAMDHYRHVADLDPTNSMALNNLAYLLLDSNQPDEAIRFAQKAGELDPNNPTVSDTIGWAFYRKGIYRTAVDHLSIAASKGSPLMKYHLAMAYLKVGDSERGLRAFQEAYKLDPNLNEAKMAKAVLDESLNVSR